MEVDSNISKVRSFLSDHNIPGRIVVCIILGGFVLSLIFLVWQSWGSEDRIKELQVRNKEITVAFGKRISEANERERALTKTIQHLQENINVLQIKLNSQRKEYESIKPSQSRQETVDRFRDLGYHPR